jgi:protein SEY1
MSEIPKAAMGEQQTLQLVDAEADYNTDGMQAFAAQSGLENCGQDYQIIAVMGPQSSGKSTLMNAVVITCATILFHDQSTGL